MMSTSTSKKAKTIAKSKRGRPRSPETKAKMLKEVGFMDLIIEAVAARALKLDSIVKYEQIRAIAKSC